MPNFTDVPTYEPGIYQLTTEDIIAGGAEGISNLPMQQLANRTRNLKNLVEKEHSAAGVHNGLALREHLTGALKNAEIKSTAAITELKLALDIVGETRPYARGAYSNVGEIADDLLYASLHSTMDTAAIDAILTPAMALHAGSTSIHTPIQTALGNIQTQLYLQYKQIIADAILSDAKLQDYPKGFIWDLASSSDIVSGSSSGYTYDTANQCFGPSIGSTHPSTILPNSTLQEDVKGGVTTFTVDTTNTAGHFNVACPSQVKVGCRVLIAGTSYLITAISTSGTGNNTVSFSGVLATGAYTVTAIYGTTFLSSTLRLSATAGGVYPVTSRYTTLCSIDSSAWRTILSTIKAEALNGGAVYYTPSFDGGVTYSTWSGAAWLPVARNNAGTWQYWNGTAWASAYSNTAQAAISDAMGISENRNVGTVLEGLLSSNWPRYWPSMFYLGVTLTSPSSSATPTFTSLSCSVRDKVSSMTLVASAPTGYVGSPSPTAAWCVVAGVPTTTFTPNTDIILYASKDGGTTWAASVMDSSVQFMPGRWVISGVATFPVGAGTSIRLKVFTAAGIEINLDALGIFVA